MESPGILLLKFPGPGKSWKMSLALEVLEIKAYFYAITTVLRPFVRDYPGESVPEG